MILLIEAFQNTNSVEVQNKFELNFERHFPILFHSLPIICGGQANRTSSQLEKSFQNDLRFDTW